VRICVPTTSAGVDGRDGGRGYDGGRGVRTVSSGALPRIVCGAKSRIGAVI